MKRFERRELFDAYAWSLAGGQALHVHRCTAPPSAPAVFRQHHLQEMGHLLDQDLDRLRATALRLGVRVVRVEHTGTRRQHVDLTGETLLRAMTECE